MAERQEKKQSNEDLYRFAHTYLRDIEEGLFTKAHLPQMAEKVEQHSIRDGSSESTLYDMVTSSIELIEANYHGCSNVKAQNYLKFFQDIRGQIQALSPQMNSFMKNLISDIRRKMLK